MSNLTETINLSTLTNNEYLIEDSTKDYVFEGITELNKNDELTLNFSKDGLVKHRQKHGNDLSFEYSSECDDENEEDISPNGTITITIKDYFEACNKLLIKTTEHTESFFNLNNLADVETDNGLEVYGNGTVYGTNADDTIYTDRDSQGNKIASNDTIYAGKGYDRIIAGKGNDTIYFNQGIDVVLESTSDEEGGGDDRIKNDKTLEFSMGDGNDTIYLDGADVINLEFESVRTAGLGDEEYQKLLDAYDPELSEDYPSSTLNVLSFQKSGNDLIIISPTLTEEKDTVTLKEFYNADNNTEIYIHNYDHESRELKEFLSIYAYAHDEKDLMFQGEKIINFSTLIENSDYSYDIDNGTCNYVFEGITELEDNDNFTLSLGYYDNDSLKNVTIDQYLKIGDDLKMDYSYLVTSFENEYAYLEDGTIVYETENGYSLDEPSTEKYTTYTVGDEYAPDFYINALTGKLSPEETIYVYKDFSVTIKDYFKTDYMNNNNLYLLYNNGYDSVNGSISSILNDSYGLVTIGNGTIYGSDFGDIIYTDEDKNENKIVSNTIYTKKGDDVVYPGQGNYTIYLDKGNKTINFEMKDEKYTIYLNGADSLTLYFESVHTAGLGYDEYNRLCNEAYDEDTDTYDDTFPKPSTGVLSYQRSGDDLVIISPTLTTKNDTVTIKDYFNSNNSTNIYIYYPLDYDDENSNEDFLGENLKDILANYSEIPPFEEDIDYTELDTRKYNSKGAEVAKADRIFVEKGDFEVIAGKGNDTITLDEGNMYLKFAKGDGIDTVYLNNATSLLLGFDDNDALSYQKQGNDLIVVSPSGTKKDDNVIIKDYFSQSNNTSVYIGEPTDRIDLNTLLEDGLVLTGASNKNNTFSDTEYNDTIIGGNKADNITLSGQGNDKIDLKKGNDIITFDELYKGENKLVVTTGKGTKTFDISNFESATFDTKKINDDLKLAIKGASSNDILVQDYFKSGASLKLIDAERTRTLKYGAGKVSGSKTDDIIYASADKKGKITVSAGDGNDYIKLETANLGTSGKYSFTANLNGGKGDDTYDLTDVDLAKGKLVVNMKDGADTIVLGNDYSFNGYNGVKTDFSYEHKIDNGNSTIKNHYQSYDYSNDLTLFFDVKLDKRGISYGSNRTGDLFLVKGADMELADGKVDRGIQLSGISTDDKITINNTSYSLQGVEVGRLMSDVATWLSENDYISTSDVFKTGDVNDIHTLIDMYATGTEKCFVNQA